MISFTHGWSWFCRILQVGAQVILAFLLMLVYDLFTKGWRINETLNMIGLVIFVLVAFFYISVTHIGPFFHVLATWLYTNRTLLAPLSWNDARTVAWMFSPNSRQRWYPLEETKQMPLDQRRGYILRKYSELMTSPVEGADDKGFSFMDTPPRRTRRTPTAKRRPTRKKGKN